MDSWPIDEDRHPPDRVLSPTERGYLMTGDPASYSESNIQDRITDKAEQIPGRIQDLIDDVCLLYYGGFLPDTQACDVSKVVPRSQTVRVDEIADPPSTSKLVFELGALIRMLDIDADADEIAWAFLVGLLGQPEDKFSTEHELIETVLAKVEERHTRRQFQAGSVVAGELYSENVEEYWEAIETELEQHDIDPAFPLVRFVLHELHSDSGMSKYYDDEVFQADPATDPPEPPDSIDAEPSYETEITVIVESLLEETQLTDIETLRTELESDVREIHQHEHFGTQADDIVEALHSATGKTKTTNIAGASQSKRMTTAVLNKLSDKDDYELWTQYPVTTEPADGRWQFTAYGDLLAHVLYERNETTSWIYYHAVNPDRLQDLESQLIRAALRELW